MPAQHSGPVLAVRDNLTVIDCRACGWAHLDPLPTVDDAYYRDTFWSEKGAGWLARYEAERDWLDMRNGDWLSVIEEHTDGRALLDVGSGYGFFLEQGYQRGWDGYGIEPSSEAHKYCSTHVHALTFHEEWQESVFKFPLDAITAFWLLEHLPDPRAFLTWARAHLAPGGVLAVCVPQEWTQEQKIANADAAVKQWWLHPTHLNYWSAPTLYGLLGRCGFRVVDALTSYPIEVHIQSGQDYTADEWVGNVLHASLRKSELSMTREKRLNMQRTTARVCIGRDLFVVCKVDA